MANTLKFGNENWATKKDSILAYNDENDNFKPLPFVTSRASTATRVNKLGLIETVASGIPRVDYLGNTKGALLLEPQRTNLFPYSEDFSNFSWNKSNIDLLTLTSDIAPNGTSNSVYNFKGDNSNLFTSSQSINVEYTISFYVKSNANGKDNFKLRLGSGFSEFTATNEWVRYSYKATPTTQVFGISSNGIDSDVLIFGAQVEEASYATSYIPNFGTALGVTRLADTASQTLPDGVIGQTEGTVFLDTVINTDVNGLTRISLSQDVSTSNWIFFSAPEVSGGLVRTRIIIYNGGNLQVNLYGGVLTSGRHKFALAYKENDVVLYVDGVLDLSDNSALIPSTNKISLIGSSPASDNADRFNKHSDFKLYNTRLSNSELQALTQV